MRIHYAFGIVLAFAACKSQVGAPGVLNPIKAPTCHPFSISLCALPWPSTVYETVDPSTATGIRLALKTESLPVNAVGIGMDPWAWNEKDGYSINSAMVLDLPGYMPGDDVPTPFHIARYEAADAPVVVVDVTTGERLPIWVEADATTDNVEQRLTFIRPAVPMQYGHHYVVGLRHLKGADGAIYAPTDAFLTVRDGLDTDDAWLKAEAERFDATLFPALENAGVPRGDLFLAWDFHTMSQDSAVGRQEQIRDLALEWADTNGFNYALEPELRVQEQGVVDYDCDAEGIHIARDINGWFEAPYFTEKDMNEAALTEEREGFLTRDKQGNSYVNGTRHVPFLLRIPCSATRTPVAGSLPLVQYGHGLLGHYLEARGYSSSQDGYLATMADRHGFAILGMNWTGFDESATPAILGVLSSKPGGFAGIIERSEQGMTELQLGVRFVQNALSKDASTAFDGVAVLSTDTAYYYGNSQGGIMGAALLAQSKDFDRGVLGVVGGPYSLLLPRSKDFDIFFDLLKTKYSDHRDIMLFVVGLIQQVWDPIEPGGWMWAFGKNGSTDKDVLLQVAIYDNQVTTMGAHIMARAYGAYTPTPAVRDIWGVPEQDVGSAGLAGPAIVEWKYPDLPPEFEAAEPPALEGALVGTEYEGCQHTDPHDELRDEVAAQDQAWHFLSTGKVIQTCDPVTGCVSTKKLCFPD